MRSWPPSRTSKPRSRVGSEMRQTRPGFGAGLAHLKLAPGRRGQSGEELIDRFQRETEFDPLHTGDQRLVDRRRDPTAFTPANDRPIDEVDLRALLFFDALQHRRLEALR